MSESEDALKSTFNRETSKISWEELQRFYARGVVVQVAAGMDLIAVAIAMHRDDKQQVETWLAEGKVKQIDDEQAQRWQQSNETLWAVVVAPWVLVQPVQANNDQPTH